MEPTIVLQQICYIPGNPKAHKDVKVSPYLPRKYPSLFMFRGSLQVGNEGVRQRSSGKTNDLTEQRVRYPYIMKNINSIESI